MKRFLLIFGFILAYGLSHSGGSFEKLSVEMNSRKVHDGKQTQVKANIYYQNNGKMVTHFYYPVENVIINNNKGEALIYNPKENSVLQMQNPIFSTETTHLYYFFKGKTGSLGLNEMGFTLRESNVEDGMVVTTWLPPISAMQKISEAKLVFEDSKPIFMGFKNQDGQDVKKTYFYDYTLVSGVTFPKTTTSIHYNSPGDSIVEKVTFSDFKINAQAKSEYFDYQIPSDAKLIK